MSTRTIILVLAALLVAGGTAFLAKSWLSRERAPAQVVQQPEAPKPRAVLVAKVDLPAGTFLKEDSVRWQPWPTGGIDANYLVEGQYPAKNLVGAVVKRGIVAGEPVTEARIARPGDRGFLAAVLKPGMRAVTISVNPVTGIAGLVFPGDRVDILLTHALPADATKYAHRASETVLENVRILAIDQSLNDQPGEPDLAKTATIEVTPKQAEMVAIVGELGALSLSLRSLGLPDDPGTAVAAQGAPSQVAAADPSIASDATVDQGPGRPMDDVAEPWRGQTFTIDNEVSRLLNRRVPDGERKVLVLHGAAAELLSFGAK